MDRLEGVLLALLGLHMYIVLCVFLISLGRAGCERILRHTNNSTLLPSICCSL